LKYALGEISLVVIGILIALSINIWNEGQKNKAIMITNIKSIGEDIKADVADIKKTNTVLHRQTVAAKHILPIMESKSRFITDSLKFILDFNSFSDTPIISERSNTWSFLNSTVVVSEFPDAKLLKMLQNYFSKKNNLITN
jgi:hypothetical protein